MLELMPNLDVSKGEPLYIQLYDFIKHEIISGTLLPGTKLPSKRKLSDSLKISQNTVETAYEQLAAEGYIESIPRRGFYICKIEQEEYEVDKSIPHVEEKPSRHEGPYNFAYTGVDTYSFPFSLYRKISGEVIRQENQHILQLGHPQGERELREEIARYLYESRGVRCSPAQIILGAGTPPLLRILFQMLPESRFAVEDPGYHRKLLLFEKGEDKIDMIPLDEEGMDVRKLEECQADIALVTPSHQFPSGAILSIARRMQLLKWAATDENRYIIEDDYDSEFRYSGKPIPALQGLDGRQKVIYLGTFSKALMPSLRISYMVLPIPLIYTYQRDYSFYTPTVSRVDQEILILFLRRGHWEKHIQKMRVTYRRKRDLLVEAITSAMPETVEVIGQDSGLHILLRPHNGMNEAELIRLAERAGVQVYPVSVYGKSDEKTVLLGFASLPECRISEGIYILAEAWFQRINKGKEDEEDERPNRR